MQLQAAFTECRMENEDTEKGPVTGSSPGSWLSQICLEEVISKAPLF